MKLRLSSRGNHALTRTDVVVIVFVVVILATLLIPLLRGARQGALAINCFSNLRAVVFSVRIWEGDNNNFYPMAVSVTNGGAMELIVTGNVAACFSVLTNELSTPRILVCPADTEHATATNFETLNNSKISYFIGIDPTNDANPGAILMGDDNFEIAGSSVKSGVLPLSANVPVEWSSGRHVRFWSGFWTPARTRFKGNIAFADGSALDESSSGLQEALQETGLATNRLAIP